MLKEQIGVEFNFKEDWKALFQRDTWFLWRDDYNADRLLLRRFTIWNVLKWYCMQVIIKCMVAFVIPIMRLNELYWNYRPELEGRTFRYISDYILLKHLPTIKFFRLKRNK